MRISFSRTHLSRLLVSFLRSYTVEFFEKLNSCESVPQSNNSKVTAPSAIFSELVERVVLCGDASIVFELLVQQLRISSAAFASLKLIELLEKFLVGAQLDRLFSELCLEALPNRPTAVHSNTAHLEQVAQSLLALPDVVSNRRTSASAAQSGRFAFQTQTSADTLAHSSEADTEQLGVSPVSEMSHIWIREEFGALLVRALLRAVDNVCVAVSGSRDANLKFVACVLSKLCTNGHSGPFTLSLFFSRFRFHAFPFSFLLVFLSSFAFPFPFLLFLLRFLISNSHNMQMFSGARCYARVVFSS